jgi:putative transcriptional regulator
MFHNSKHFNGGILMILRNNIAQFRKIYNVTQQELADKIGIKRTSLSQIENGMYNPRASTMIKIAEALNVPFADLFFTENVYNHETK